MTTTYGEGWACQDCTLLLANGQAPPYMDEEEYNAYLDNIDRNLGHLSAHVGGSHDTYCETLVTEHHEDCNCQSDKFSSTTCDVCLTNLAGYRHKVTFTQPG